jgi:hypothetical protein
VGRRHRRALVTVVECEAPELPKPSAPLETPMTDVIQGATEAWVLGNK